MPNLENAPLSVGEALEAMRESCAKVADGAYVRDKEKEEECLAAARDADSTSGREVDLEYAVSFARRANGDRAIAAAIRALPIPAALATEKAKPTEPVVAGWQTMDSAPKDGSEFVGYDAATGTQHVTHWDQYGWYDPDSHYYSETEPFQPTHWTPLPTPPSQEDGK